MQSIGTFLFLRFSLFLSIALFACTCTVRDPGGTTIEITNEKKLILKFWMGLHKVNCSRPCLFNHISRFFTYHKDHCIRVSGWYVWHY